MWIKGQKTVLFLSLSLVYTFHSLSLGSGVIACAFISTGGVFLFIDLFYARLADMLCDFLQPLFFYRYLGTGTRERGGLV